MRGRRAKAYGPYKHGDKFRVHFVTGSGRNRETTYEVFASWADAQKCYDDATDEAEGITVNAAIKAYIDLKRVQGRAELTAVAYNQRLRTLLASYLNRPIRSIARRGTELYTEVLAGRRADSHQNLLVAGRLFGKWCVKQRWLKTNPFADVEPVGRRTHGADKIRLTIDESRKLEAWCITHPADQGAVLTLAYLYLGARNTELGLRRTVRDLDDEGRLLWIRKTKTEAGRRVLSIPDPLSSMMLALVAGRSADAAIFTSAYGKPMPSNTACRHVRRVSAAAGVPVVPPQALRRTHASIAIEANATGHTVARALGHAVAVAPKVTAQSYIDRNVTTAAQGERVLRIIRGGRS